MCRQVCVWVIPIFFPVCLLLRFHKELASGLLEVISPRAEYYPNMSDLKVTFGDTAERVK